MLLISLISHLGNRSNFQVAPPSRLWNRREFKPPASTIWESLGSIVMVVAVPPNGPLIFQSLFNPKFSGFTFGKSKANEKIVAASKKGVRRGLVIRTNFVLM